MWRWSSSSGRHARRRDRGGSGRGSALPARRPAPAGAGRSLTLDCGWYFVLESDGPDRSRLLARWRIASGPLNVAFALLFDLPHFLMERKMLLGIKSRAENTS